MALRMSLAAAVLAFAAAVAPTVALAAVPKAGWYWTLVVSASDPNTFLLGTGNGLYRSGDGGKRWQPAGPSGVNATSLAQAGNTLFMGGVRTRAGAKPVVVQGGAYVSAPGQGVLAASVDGGLTWRVLSPRGLPSAGVQALAADPANGSLLYAVLQNGVLYRSTDGGRSFRLVAATIGGTPWALALTEGGHLLAGDMTSGSYLSATGKQWQRTAFADSKGGSMVMEYASQPGDSAHVLMTSYGVLMSTDGGRSWQAALKSKVMFGPVAWAPGSPRVAYAVGWDRTVWRTNDAGKSWAKTS